jgi:hypothetical protein
VSDLSLGQLELAWRQAARDIDREIATEVRATAAKVADTQRATVPVHTGRTRDSIKATGPDGAPLTPTSTEAEIGPTWFVGGLIETGTATQAPRPFVGPSYAPHRADHERRVLDAGVRAALRGLGG